MAQSTMTKTNMDPATRTQIVENTAKTLKTLFTQLSSQGVALKAVPAPYSPDDCGHRIIKTAPPQEGGMELSLMAASLASIFAAHVQPPVEQDALKANLVNIAKEAIDLAADKLEL